jgi:tetratricopeptide (TPR) repeat protein
MCDLFETIQTMIDTNTSQVSAAQLFNEGNAAYRRGEWAHALTLTEGALRADPSFVSAALLRARCLVHMGEWMSAREAFAQTLRLDMRNYSAWLEAGHLCKQMGELTQAAASYQRAIDVAPERYEAYLGMARVMAQQGHTDMANRAYNDAVQAAMSVGVDAVRQVHWLMGQYVLELGFAQEALGCFNDALKSSQAQDEATLTNLVSEIQMDAARAWLRLGERDKAMKLLSLASGATQEATLSRLAALSFRNNFWQEAIEISRRCVALYPKSAWAHWNLAHLLAECWQMQEAEQVLQQAESLAPMPGARSLRAAVAGKVGDADAAMALYVALAREEGVGSTFSSSAAMSALYSDTLSAQEVADLHRELFADWGKGARTRDSFVRKPLSGRRVRLGLVSADFHHQHPVNIFMQPMLRELNRDLIELFVYFVGESHDAQTTLARSRTEHWVEASTLNARQLAKRIDADEIDV